MYDMYNICNFINDYIDKEKMIYEKRIIILQVLHSKEYLRCKKISVI